MRSIKDFGAQGDGVTDDTAAIQNAIYTCTETLLFPSGVYLVSSPLHLRSGSALVGDTLAVIKLKDGAHTTNWSMFFAEGTVTTDISLKNLIIDGNRDNNANYGAPIGPGNYNAFHGGNPLAAINLTNVENFSIENCTIKNMWANGIWATDCRRGRIEHCTVEKVRKTAIAIRTNPNTVDKPSRDIVLCNNTITECTVGLHGIFGVENILYKDNTITKCSDIYRFPVGAFLGTYPNVYPNDPAFLTDIDTGYISPALLGDGAGIELSGGLTDPSSQPNRNNFFIGNYVEESIVGLRAEELSRSTVISNNVCKNNTMYGIFVFSASDGTISGNVTTDNGHYGVRIEKYTHLPAPNNWVVSGNIMTNNGKGPISVVQATNVAISNNVGT